MPRKYPTVTCKCHECGHEHTHAASWFQKHRKCLSCGGKLDLAPIFKLVKTAYEQRNLRMKHEAKRTLNVLA